MLEHSALRYATRQALTRPDGTGLSYSELVREVRTLRSVLHRAGVTPTDRVAVVLPNGFDFATGILTVGTTATALPMRAGARPDEYLRDLARARVSHLVTCINRVPDIVDVAQRLGIRVWHLTEGAGGFELQRVLPSAQSARTRRPEVRGIRDPEPHEVAVVLPTSGSTGHPKLVPLTHRNLQVGATNVAEALALTPEDRALVLWEQHHIGGLVDLLLAPLCVGSEVVLGGSFEVTRFYELLATREPTWFQGVPTTLREIARAGRTGRDLPHRPSSLRLLRSVAAALPTPLMHELEESFGVPVIQTFGMTEASPLITTQPLPPEPRVPGSVGRPSGCEVVVLDATTGRAQPPGEEGDLAIRGENVFSGYEDDPEANKSAFRHGWFLTGDRGRFDTSGVLYLTGRTREIINRGGEKISPIEVEEVLLASERIDQAAAFAVPHPTLGEDIGVAIVPTPQASITAPEVRDVVRDSLSAHKVPSIVLVLPELPRSHVGKIDRRQLQAMAPALADSLARGTAEETAKRPSDPVERRITDIWKSHLDLFSVARDEEFAVLGGDSLAELRMRLEVEHAFGISLNLVTPEDMRTVASLSAFVGRQLQRSTPSGPEPVASSAPTPRAPLTWEGWRRALLRAPSELECRARLEDLLNTHTFDEVSAVVGAMSWWRSTAVRTWARWMARRRFVLINAALDLQQMSMRLPETGAVMSWHHRRLLPGADLYSPETQRGVTRSLLIVWAGNHGRPMMPAWLFLAHLGHRHDVLLLADRHRRHFEQGISGIATDLPALQHWIREFMRTTGYREASTLGTSAGGLAAIHCGLELGCRHIAAVGADRLSSHPGISTLLERSLMRERPTPRICLAYDTQSVRDRDGAEELRRRLPACEMLEITDLGIHNALYRAFEDGRLLQVMDSLIPSLRS